MIRLTEPDSCMRQITSNSPSCCKVIGALASCRVTRSVGPPGAGATACHTPAGRWLEGLHSRALCKLSACPAGLRVAKRGCVWLQGRGCNIPRQPNSQSAAIGQLAAQIMGCFAAWEHGSEHMSAVHTSSIPAWCCCIMSSSETRSRTLPQTLQK